jgi:hypothetical protein
MTGHNRPSMSSLSNQRHKDANARHKAGHHELLDEGWFFG